MPVMPQPGAGLLRLDPTRSVTQRRHFLAELKRRLNCVKRAVVLDIENDTLRFYPASDRLSYFQSSLRSLLARELLDAAWWQAFLRDGWRRGAGRAFDDVTRRRGERGDRDTFLRLVANKEPITGDERMRLQFARALSDLEGLSEAMVSSMSRVLADGFARGQNPRTIARDLAKQVDGLGKKRAEAIALTECLPGETLVDRAVVRAVFRRWYDGPMVEVKTRHGRKFSATPNHPMLTQDGWVPAGLLKQGDKLVGDGRKQNSSLAGDPNVPGSPATLREIFDSFQAVGVFERHCTGEPDFHGDGRNGEVDVFCPDGELRIGDFAAVGKPLAEKVFSPAGFVGSRFCPACGCLLAVNEQACFCEVSQRDILVAKSSLDEPAVHSEAFGYGHSRFASKIAANDVVGVNVGSVAIANAAVEPGLTLPFGIGAADAFLSQDFADLLLFRSNFDCDLPLCEPGQVEFDDVLSVSIRPFSGHVYNLETPFGYFAIDSLYTGNTSRAYAEGQLEALEQLGVAEVGVEVEWLVSGLGSTKAGYPSPCPQCAPMAGKVFKIAEARGLIPLHPRCKCAWAPHVGD